MERTFNVEDIDEHLFKRDLRSLLNSYTVDGYTGTPDYILADSIWRHIEDVSKTARETVRWHNS